MQIGEASLGLRDVPKVAGPFSAAVSQQLISPHPSVLQLDPKKHFRD